MGPSVHFNLETIESRIDLSVASSTAIPFRVATKIFEDFGGALFKAFIIGWELGLEPVSIINYTRPGSSIKWPSPN